MKQAIPDDVISTSGKSLVPTLVSGAVIVAALYYGQELLVPLVLATLLAFVLAPICDLLQKIWLPRVVAVLAAVVLTFALFGAIGVVVGRQAASLANSLPTYQSTITTKWTALTARVGAVEQLTKDLTAKTGQPAPAGDKGKAEAGLLGSDVTSLSLARSVALPILGPLGTAGVMLVFTFFILVSSEDLRDRLVRLVGRHDLHRTILAMNDAARRLSRYFLYQLALNTAFGAIIGLALWYEGLPNPLLWAILAAVMRFVPFIGVVVAVVPPLLLAVAIVPGWSLALIVLVLFASAETVMGQVVEPLIYGHNTGLSPLAVIVATAFWALIWGPIGLLIATPLTVCLVVIGRHVETLAFLDVILGDKPPLEPPETFYQRALEGRALTLAPGARKRIAAGSYADYFDKVALPGLALAQGDLARDDSAFERLDAIHLQIEALLVDLYGGRAVRPDDRIQTKSPALKDWSRQGAIACIPGRGQLDDLAASMAVHALSEAGFGARIDPNLVLGGGGQTESFASTRLCCLSILEEGSTSAAIRYFVRRVQKQMPGTKIVIGLWHVDRDSPLLSTLRAEGGDEHVVLSIGELLAFCQALAARERTQPGAA